ncbi:DUF6332 family protein [Streptomyces sp. CA-294286]|uniref:DUF6332 family protein n=1 Tax=Streptomyces sp. CA-294286 TaxID=3240070 RepID=UPI003D8FD6A9
METGARPRRTQAQRDAMTIEIGYALVSAAVLAVVTLCALLTPDYFLDLSPAVARILHIAAGTLAAAVFLMRLVHVLRRYRGAPGTRPGHPGRTRADA